MHLLVAHHELKLWLTDCHLIFWHHFEEEEERKFYEKEQQYEELQNVT